MLLICAGMMRSGSVVQFQLAGAVVNHLGIGDIVKPRDGKVFDEMVDAWAFDDRWHVAKLHDYRESIMRAHDQGRVKVVMTVRDPRDIMVSLMNFRNDTFETMTHAPVFPNNLKNQAIWSSVIHATNFRCMKYEDMVTNLGIEPFAIALFIDHAFSMSASDSSNIAEKYSIRQNKLRAAAAYPVSSPDYFSKRHIHDGSSGQWRRALNEDQIRWIESIAKDFMETNGYELAYPGSNHTDV